MQAAGKIMTDFKKDWPEGAAPAEWVNPKVHKMRCLSNIAGVFGHYQSDLVFINGVPYAVFEWDEFEDGTNIPSAAVQLDPSLLHTLPESWAPVRWMYEKVIEDPRKLH